MKLDISIRIYTRVLGCLLVVFSASSAFGQTSAAQKSASQCNAPPSAAVSYVSMPGRPFKAITTRDGCWIFVSVNGGNQTAPRGVAVVERDQGKLKVKNLFETPGPPSGVDITHDEKLLMVTDGSGVVFMDVAAMMSGHGNPILGSISDGEDAGSIYVSVTADDKFLFVSDERAFSITVINLEKARANHFAPDSIVGKI